MADVVEIKMNFVLNQHTSLKFGFRWRITLCSIADFHFDLLLQRKLFGSRMSSFNGQHEVPGSHLSWLDLLKPQKRNRLARKWFLWVARKGVNLFSTVTRNTQIYCPLFPGLAGKRLLPDPPAMPLPWHPKVITHQPKIGDRITQENQLEVVQGLTITMRLRYLQLSRLPIFNSSRRKGRSKAPRRSNICGKRNTRSRHQQTSQ